MAIWSCGLVSVVLKLPILNQLPHFLESVMHSHLRHHLMLLSPLLLLSAARLDFRMLVLKREGQIYISLLRSRWTNRDNGGDHVVPLLLEYRLQWKVRELP